MTTSGLIMRCTLTEQCSFHAAGGPELEKCPAVCDALDCAADATVDVGDERSFCGVHAGLLLLARSLRDALAADDASEKGGAR